jgi:hypothetical protein
MSEQPQAEPTHSPVTGGTAGPDPATPPLGATPPPSTTPPPGATAPPPPGGTAGPTRPVAAGEPDTAAEKLTRLAARGIGKAIKTTRETIDAARSNETVSRAVDGVKEHVAENPRTAEKLARRATFTAMTAAAAASPGGVGKVPLRRATPIVVNQVGKVVGRISKGEDEDLTTETGLVKLAARLDERPRPNPAELYQDGTSPLELQQPLPPELAAIPWEPLARKDRFCLLVAAWAYREADGVESIRYGQFGQATTIFQECLRRAEYLNTPELVVRSYEDLAQVAMAKGDEKTAQNFRLAAAQTKDDAGLKPDSAATDAT